MGKPSLGGKQTRKYATRTVGSLCLSCFVEIDAGDRDNVSPIAAILARNYRKRAGNRSHSFGAARKALTPMTRSKDLRRIESAIERRDQQELRWAASYCKLRIGWILTKAGVSRSRQAGASQWRKIEKRVHAAQHQDTDE